MEVASISKGKIGGFHVGGTRLRTWRQRHRIRFLNFPSAKQEMSSIQFGTMISLFCVKNGKFWSLITENR